MATDFQPVLDAIAELNQKVLDLQTANVNDERAATKLATAQVEKDTTDAALIDADAAADEALKIVITKLKDYGVSTEEQVELFRNLDRSPDLSKLLAFLVQYGPQIMAIIKLLSK